MYMYMYICMYIIGGRDLSIPAYFIPAHVDGAWSKILGCCCCCSAAWDRTASNFPPKTVILFSMNGPQIKDLDAPLTPSGFKLRSASFSFHHKQQV